MALIIINNFINIINHNFTHRRKVNSPVLSILLLSENYIVRILGVLTTSCARFHNILTQGGNVMTIVMKIGWPGNSVDSYLPLSSTAPIPFPIRAPWNFRVSKYSLRDGSIRGKEVKLWPCSVRHF